MRRPGSWVVALLIGGLLTCAASADAQTRSTGGKSLSDLAADVVRAMTDYRAALVRTLPAYEAALRETTQDLNERRELHGAGHLDVAHVQQAERAWAAARDELAAHRKAIVEADNILFAASVHERLSRLTPLARNRYEDAHGFVRFNGQAPWSPRNLPTIAAAFEKTFGRRIDVSANGQTALHTRLGLDHRNAVDVAVHPDTAEGRWLIAYLREARIPFIGIRDVIPGSSTGPHIHIGAPALRTLPR
jgi:hypothetical protein